MGRVGDLFRVCPRYEPDPAIMRLEHERRCDCVNCARNYQERVCPILRARFLKVLGLEVRRR